MNLDFLMIQSVLTGNSILTGKSILTGTSDFDRKLDFVRKLFLHRKLIFDLNRVTFSRCHVENNLWTGNSFLDTVTFWGQLQAYNGCGLWVRFPLGQSFFIFQLYDSPAGLTVLATLYSRVSV